MFAFLQAIQFVVGVYVLLAGVRLLLGEIVPAFRGIAMNKFFFELKDCFNLDFFLLKSCS
ncbi:hypothetical protein EfmGK941_25040 [Enterococcus faecium]|nr:hypothetical protein EfmGK941_25040 [Enterococcus faecium]